MPPLTGARHKRRNALSKFVRRFGTRQYGNAYARFMVRIGNFLVMGFCLFCVDQYYHDKFYFIWVPLYSFTGLLCTAMVYDPYYVHRLPLGKIFLAVVTIVMCGVYALFQRNWNPFEYEADRKISELSFTLLWMGQLFLLKKFINWSNIVVNLGLYFLFMMMRFYFMYYYGFYPPVQGFNETSSGL